MSGGVGRDPNQWENPLEFRPESGGNSTSACCHLGLPWSFTAATGCPQHSLIVFLRPTSTRSLHLGFKLLRPHNWACAYVFSAHTYICY